jgi:hypothetical protein
LHLTREDLSCKIYINLKGSDDKYYKASELPATGGIDEPKAQIFTNQPNPIAGSHFLGLGEVPAGFQAEKIHKGSAID